MNELKEALSANIDRAEGEKVDCWLVHGLAREIFQLHENVVRDLYRASTSFEQEDQLHPNAFFNAVIGENESNALSNILATLLWLGTRPNSESWERFKNLCGQSIHQRRFTDRSLPLTKHDVGELLGETNLDRDNFSQIQYIFSPLVLEKGSFIDQSDDPRPSRVPCVKEKLRNTGAYGMVYKVTLAGNHFDRGENRRTVCARKDFNITKRTTFDDEWKNVILLSRSKQGNANITEIFAGLCGPTTSSLFCELADCDLDKYMKSPNGPADLAGITRRLIQFRDLVRAVRYLHTELQSDVGARQSCIHLDIKPGNILVFDHGGPHEIFKICDFSLSRAKDQAQCRHLLHSDKSIRDVSTKAQLGDICACLAPEAYGPIGKVNGSNDIWHLGCVLSMFMAWLNGGRKGLTDFNYRRWIHKQYTDWFFVGIPQNKQPSETEPNYWRVTSDHEGYMIFNINPEVTLWLNELPGTVQLGQTATLMYFELAQLVKNDMLICDFKKRSKIEEICRKLDTIVDHVSQDFEDTTSM